MSPAARVETAWGVDTEVAPLSRVLLAHPMHGLLPHERPEDQLMVGRPDLTRLRRQAAGLAAAFEQEGVRVSWCQSGRPYPNYIFVRDLFLMTPEGALLARPASAIRAGEEREAAAALARIGVPVIRAFQGSATFEGADALWIAPGLVLVGVGQRTNRAGFTQLRAALRGLGTEVVAVPFEGPTQHLLGVVNIIDRRLFVTVRRRTPAAAVSLLREHGYSDGIEFEGDGDVDNRRALNFVTLRPGHVLMPHAPKVRRRLEQAGVRVSEVKVGDYLKAGGGAACATGIIQRRMGGIHGVHRTSA
jgi:N-dimethylarginine dimethylaminohydrolase